MLPEGGGQRQTARIEAAGGRVRAHLAGEGRLRPLWPARGRCRGSGSPSEAFERRASSFAKNSVDTAYPPLSDSNRSDDEIPIASHQYT